MTIDWTKPIETVEGHPARVLSTDHRHHQNTLTVIQIEYPGRSSIGFYCQNGEPALGSLRIRNRKTKREGWINVYRDNYASDIFGSREEALLHSRSNIIDTIKIEWEE